ncbi:MAG TPA: class I SAM-dependent methyltransferase [Kofleriaceae bacterium]|nr:class I SAM-dependent methyltransferase [Kofleriaceae bacterium]
MLSRLDRLAYHSQHLSFLINATVMEEATRLITRRPRPTIDNAVWKCLQHRRSELHRRDLKNVDAGHYPRELLFDFPVRRFIREFPRLVRDAPRVVRRMRAKDYKDIPEVDKERFPPYYRRTFHWQTDGYFSEHSATVYELGVELLFRGTADVMRRQIIPPISELVKASGGADKVRVLDVGCGTGRTLHQLAIAHPTMRLHGCDMSPAYIKMARTRLEHIQELTLAVENGEALPWADATFDVVTSTYMFHELPRNARRNVVREMLRVVRPGGLVVIEDSAQLSESPELEPVLEGFPAEFHEPFYSDYLGDDLGALLDEVGFDVQRTEPHLVAKVVVGTRA